MKNPEKKKSNTTLPPAKTGGFGRGSVRVHGKYARIRAEEGEFDRKEYLKERQEAVNNTVGELSRMLEETKKMPEKERHFLFSELMRQLRVEAERLEDAKGDLYRKRVKGEPLNDAEWRAEFERAITFSLLKAMKEQASP